MLRFVAPAALAVGYVGLALVGGPALAGDVFDLAALPLAATAAAFGLRAGLAAVVGACALNATIGWVARVPLEDAVSPAHVVVFAALGVGFGLLAEQRDRLRAESLARRASEERLRALLADAPMALVAVDARGRYILREGAFLDAVGAAPNGTLIGEDAVATMRERFPGEPRAAANLARALRGEAFSDTITLRGRRVLHEYRPVRDASGAIREVIAVLTDVTALEHAQTETRRTEARLQAIVASANDAIITVDAAGRIVLFNAAAERIFGRSAAAVLGTPIVSLMPDDARAAHRGHLEAYVRDGAGGRDLSALRVRAVRANGEEFPADATLSRIEVGGEVLATVILRDVSERVRQQAELSRLALRDALTDLPNRNLFRDRLEHALQDAVRRGESVALLLVDLDRFREVNDTFGHSTGDALLRLVGPRLSDALRQTDTIARLSGDEFAVLLPAAGVAGARAIAQKLHGLLEMPFDVDGHVVAIGASVGIAVYPDHAVDAGTLLRRADVAMYQAKDAGSAVVLYAPTADEDGAARLALITDLRRALERDELEVHYQPIVAASDGAARAAEALLRWRHRERGLVPPAEFIPLAERAGLMPALTDWVLGRALAQVAAWRAEGLDLAVAVNLSSRSLVDPELPATVASRLARHGLPASALCLEITESAIMSEPERAHGILARLREMGVQLQIDDFGTGYSSLAYLQRLPVVGVKIDRSFVTQMRSDGASASIVRSTIELAHSLDLGVVAEGVEDDATARELAALGCDSLQGYGICRPVPADAFAEWLGSSPGRVASGPSAPRPSRRPEAARP